MTKEPKFSVLQANAQLVQKMESVGIGVRGEFFCFHVVKPLMTILALLSISGVSKNLY